MPSYEDFQPGDYVYFQEKSHMLFCRIVAVRNFADRPDFTGYVLHIVDQWYNHDFFEPFSIFLFGRRLSVGRSKDGTANVPWNFYNQQEFERYYPHTQREPHSRRWIALETGCRRIAIGFAILLVLLAAYLVYRVIAFVI